MTLLDLLMKLHVEKIHELSGDIKNSICELEDISLFSPTPESMAELDSTLAHIYETSTKIMEEADKFKSLMDDVSSETEPINTNRKITEMEI